MIEALEQSPEFVGRPERPRWPLPIDDLALVNLPECVPVQAHSPGDIGQILDIPTGPVP